jgi:hypothetical protein
MRMREEMNVWTLVPPLELEYATTCRTILQITLVRVITFQPRMLTVRVLRLIRQ